MLQRKTQQGRKYVECKFCSLKCIFPYKYSKATKKLNLFWVQLHNIHDFVTKYYVSLTCKIKQCRKPFNITFCITTFYNETLFARVTRWSALWNKSKQVIVSPIRLTLQIVVWLLLWYVHARQNFLVRLLQMIHVPFLPPFSGLVAPCISAVLNASNLQWIIGLNLSGIADAHPLDDALTVGDGIMGYFIASITNCAHKFITESTKFSCREHAARN